MGRIILSIIISGILICPSTVTASDIPEKTIAPSEAKAKDDRNKEDRLSRLKEKSNQIKRENRTEREGTLINSQRQRVYEQEVVEEKPRVSIQNGNNHIIYPVDETDYPLGQGKPPKW